MPRSTNDGYDGFVRPRHRNWPLKKAMIGQSRIIESNKRQRQIATTGYDFMETPAMWVDSVTQFRNPYESNRPVNFCESRSSRRSSRKLRSPTMKIGSLYPTTQSRVSDKSSKNADETDAEPGRYITTTMQVDFLDVIRVHSNSNEVGLPRLNLGLCLQVSNHPGRKSHTQLTYVKTTRICNIQYYFSILSKQLT